MPVFFEYLDIVASLAFLVWDWIIHIDDEVEYIWMSSSNWMTWMYLFLRYFPIVVECSLVVLSNARPSLSICKSWHVYQAFSIVILTIAVEVVLVVRIYALWSRKKAIIVPVLVLWLVEMASMIVSMCFAVPRMRYVGPCMVTYAPPCLMGYWMSTLAFESILWVLTLVKFFQFAPLHRRQGTLLHVFMRDGTWAYTVTFVVMLVNGIAVNAHVHTPLAGVCYQWAMAGFSCAGSHMLLNLRQFAHQANNRCHKGHTHDPALAHQHSSGLCFAAPGRHMRSAFFTTEIDLYSQTAGPQAQARALAIKFDDGWEESVTDSISVDTTQSESEGEVVAMTPSTIAVQDQDQVHEEERRGARMV
ncbi:hypothetical protein EIP91_004564 [Steccherinum ochraceum]|uniref:DUF6533 domain-containing protein n=1 Tax=Steccherinum ochraceum TaxID=92696 RepID=A0A4R0R9B9_9APHY|nr:hypothetical protein EIP91_004564 [Steccherinum ochraceum]